MKKITEILIEGTQHDHLQASDFGLPAQRKYPMVSKAGVRLAASKFAECKASFKPMLARNIMKKAKEFGVEIKAPEVLKYAGVQEPVEKKTPVKTEKPAGETKKIMIGDKIRIVNPETGKLDNAVIERSVSGGKVVSFIDSKGRHSKGIVLNTNDVKKGVEEFQKFDLLSKSSEKPADNVTISQRRELAKILKTMNGQFSSVQEMIDDMKRKNMDISTFIGLIKSSEKPVGKKTQLPTHEEIVNRKPEVGDYFTYNSNPAMVKGVNPDGSINAEWYGWRGDRQFTVNKDGSVKQGKLMPNTKIDKNGKTMKSTAKAVHKMISIEERDKMSIEELSKYKKETDYFYRDNGRDMTPTNRKKYENHIIGLGLAIQTKEKEAKRLESEKQTKNEVKDLMKKQFGHMNDFKYDPPESGMPSWTFDGNTRVWYDPKDNTWLYAYGGWQHKNSKTGKYTHTWEELKSALGDVQNSVEPRKDKLDGNAIKIADFYNKFKNRYEGEEYKKDREYALKYTTKEYLDIIESSTKKILGKDCIVSSAYKNGDLIKISAYDKKNNRRLYFSQNSQAGSSSGKVNTIMQVTTANSPIGEVDYHKSTGFHHVDMEAQGDYNPKGKGYGAGTLQDFHNQIKKLYKEYKESLK